MSSEKSTKLAIQPDTLKLFKISQHLTEDQFQSLKHLCEDVIPEGDLEKIKDAKKLFKKIGDMDEDGGGGKKFISELLQHIGREDLHRMLNDLPEADNKAASQTGKLNKDVWLLVANKIGTDWRRLGRHLYVDDDIIDQIDEDKKTCFDKAYELLRKWSKQYSDEATTQKLKETLLKIPRKDIADQINGIDESGNSNAKKDSEYSYTKNDLTDAPQRQSSKFHIESYGGHVFVGDFGDMTINQTNSNSATPFVIPKTAPQYFASSSKPQDSNKPKDSSKPKDSNDFPSKSTTKTTKSSSTFNVRVFGGTARVGDGISVKVKNEDTERKAENKGSQENEEKSPPEAAL
eukprot:gene7964-8822_t